MLYHKSITRISVVVFFILLPIVSNGANFLVSQPDVLEIDNAIFSASEKTNARPTVLYGLLGQETGYGGYLGKTESGWKSFCSTRDTEDCSNWRNYDCHTDYRNARHFDEILRHLGYEKKDIPTSSTCALGFTQFEPNTWWEVLGGNLQGLNPWNINDAVLMSAYFLEDLGADKTEILGPNDVIGKRGDFIALQKYYCGGNYYDRLECENYARGVEAKARRAPQELLAKSYEQQLELLETRRSVIRKQLRLPELPKIKIPKIEIRNKPPKARERPAKLTITPSGALPDGMVGTSYTVKFSASGGTAPYKWTQAFDGQKLPDGLQLDSFSGTIFGMPTMMSDDIAFARNFYFFIKVTDSKGVEYVERMDMMVVKPLYVLPFEFWSGRVGVPYEEWLQYVGGGYSPYTWSLVSGSLPPGLRLSHEVFESNPPGGVILGIPTAGGGFEFTLKVTDSHGTSVTRDGHIKIKPAPQQPISIKGRMIDRFSKKAVGGVFLRTITPELEEYEEEDVSVMSDKEGRFVTLVDGAKIATVDDISTDHSSNNCYDARFHVLEKDQGGNLQVRVEMADFSEAGDINNTTSREFKVNGSEVDMGDILLWPTVQQLIIYSDIKVGAEVEFKERSLGGQVNFENEQYLSEAIRLNIPMRAKLTDQAGNIYYSPLITIPLDYGCKPVTLQFSVGQFKWKLEP